MGAVGGRRDRPRVAGALPDVGLGARPSCGRGLPGVGLGRDPSCGARRPRDGYGSVRVDCPSVFRTPRNYVPIVSIIAFEGIAAFRLFHRRIAAALLDPPVALPWTAFDTGVVVVLVLGLAVGIWLWRYVEAE